MAAFLTDLFSNKILISVLVSVTTANLIKFLLYRIAYDKWDVEVMFKTGGMPSSHTAAVVSLSTALYFAEGGVTSLFVVSSIFSVIIVSDAVGIRRAAGRQAYVINKIIEDIALFKKFKTRRLYELLGHSPKQVMVGALLGFIMPFIIYRI